VLLLALLLHLIKLAVGRLDGLEVDFVPTKTAQEPEQARGAQDCRI
jgi:hypothetical protein